MIHWLLAEIHPQSPLFWLLVSIVSTVGLAVAFWRTRSPWVVWLWIGQWILVPYLGLLSGGLSPRLMGLAYLDWPATLGLGSGLVFVMLLLLVTVRAAVELSDRYPGETQSQPAAYAPAVDQAVASSAPAWRTILLVIFLSGAEEFHWVFLRGAVWEILLTAPVTLELPAYWAIWIAAALVLLETALRRPSFEQWLLQIAVLTTTSILFLYTRNFWICWILHSAAVLILITSSRTQLSLPGRANPARR